MNKHVALGRSGSGFLILLFAWLGLSCEVGTIGSLTQDDDPVCPEGCEDQNPCTDDICQQGACLHTPIQASCDDGDPCTAGDWCVLGTCQGVLLDQDLDGDAPVACGGGDCDDTDPAVNSDEFESAIGDAACADGKDNDCDGLTDGADPGCQACAEDAACDDGNVCNGVEHCAAGACVAGTALNCDDGNPCTTDSCDPAQDCQHQNSTVSCDDNDPCTEGDVCAEGSCQGTVVDQDQDGDPPVACGGGDCDDTDPAVNSEEFESANGDAVCADGKDNDCDGLTDGADPGCQACAEDNACDDGNVCNGAELCGNGACQAGAPLNCDDNNACTTDSCDPALGCQHQNNESCGGGPCSVDATLSVLVSPDKSSWASRIDLPSFPTKYYLNVQDSSTTQPCGANFEVKYKCVPAVSGCDSNYATTTPGVAWGRAGDTCAYAFRSRPGDGVARIDLVKSLAAGTHVSDRNIYLQVRPVGSTAAFSNEVQIHIGPAAQPPTIDFLRYFLYTPGYQYFYTSENKRLGSNYNGNSYIQFEQKRTWCGYSHIPMRFNKDSNFGYWAPSFDPNDSATNWVRPYNREALRWPIIDPNFVHPSNIAGYNSFIYATSGNNYPYNGNMRDIDPMYRNYPSYRGQTTSTSSVVPDYVLGVKQLKVPNLDDNQGFRNTPDVYSSPVPPQTNYSQPWCWFTPSQMPNNQNPVRANSHWINRWDLVNINITNGDFSYTGEALKIDFFEHQLRESWYFVKDVGLVMIKTKEFCFTNGSSLGNGMGSGCCHSSFVGNDYKGVPCNAAYWDPGDPAAAPAFLDPDSTQDEIENPASVMTLKKYFHNPTLTVQVSSDGASYSNTASTTSANGYHFKVTNPSNYTGYLELQDSVNGAGAGNPRKWLWVENGYARADSAAMVGVVSGTHAMSYRVWIPNEVFGPVEALTASNNLPWSNQVTVSVTGVATMSFVTETPALTDLRNDYTSSAGLGMQITVGPSPVTVTALCRYHVISNSGNHTLSIFPPGGTPGTALASAVVNMGAGTTDSNHFKCVPLSTPRILEANTSYYIVSSEGSGGDYWYGNTFPTLTTTDIATVVSGVFWSGISWVSYGGANNSYIPVNFQYDAID